MSAPAIRVENLSKRYVISHTSGSRDGLRNSLETAFRNPLSWLKSRRAAQRQPKDEFWALRDVSFDVAKGEVVGIIGRNGAGKSTLLKLLSRITEPTSGRISIEGRVASLLEVGTGFHPELTGRENIFLNGAILGMSRNEITRKFDEIVDFAEVERFLDTPVKRYSSGMYVRLAFAVAAHLEPEILIIDEVLAVGDAQFQKKCLGKMDEVSRGGRTVLFVSHNMAAVSQLTSRCVLINKGQVQATGATADCVSQYLEISEAKAKTHFDLTSVPRKVHGTHDANFRALDFERELPIFNPSEPFAFAATIEVQRDLPSLRFSMTVYAADGAAVGCCFGNEGSGLRAGSRQTFRVTLPDHRLAPGHYYCGVAMGKGNHRTGFVDYDVVLDTLSFEIRPEEGDGGTLAHWNKNWGSVILPALTHERAG